MESGDFYLSDVHTFSSCEVLPSQTFAVSRFQLLLKGGKFCARNGKRKRQVQKCRYVEDHALWDTDSKTNKRHLDSLWSSDKGYVYDDDGDLILERRDATDRDTEANSSFKEKKCSGHDSVFNIEDPFSDVEYKKKRKLSLTENDISPELTTSSQCLSKMCNNNINELIRNSAHQENVTESKVVQENYALVSNEEEHTNLINQQISNISYDKPNDCMEKSNYSALGCPESNSEAEDLEVPRKLLSVTSTSSYQEACYINIKHSLATSLQLVGEQVWHGALLLCDYLLYHHEILRGGLVVDLGAGTGLTSIVAAMFADSVFCTDTGDSILALAQYNTDSARLNSTLPQPMCSVQVRDLDWCRGVRVSDLESQYGVSKEDVTDIQGCSLLLAADVVYDDGLTDAFFTTVRHLFSHPPNKHLYIGLERRMVFTLEDLDVTSPGYNHFRQCLKNLVYRTDNSGNRTDNSGNRTDNSGNRTDNSGNRTDNSGDRTDNSGDRTDNSGDRTDNSGDRTDNSGNRTDNSGNRTDNSGNRTDNSGDRTDNSGNGTDNSGDRIDNFGTRTDNSGNRTDSMADSYPLLTCEQISTDFPQFFQYNRTEQLELWRISSHHSNT